MNRTQFTFYESFFRAVSCIKKAADRAQAYDLICRYALYGEEPDTSGLPDSVAVAFEMVKPNLASSRRKATSGKKGGEQKQTGSKPEANAKQTGSKGNPEARETPKQEKEQEKEQVQVQDKEQMLSPLPLLPEAGSVLRTAFSEWLDYKDERKEGYKPTGLKALQTEVMNNARKHGEDTVARLIRHCMANGWKGIIFELLVKDGGRFKQTALFDDSERKPQGGDFLAFLAESGVEV